MITKDKVKKLITLPTHNRLTRSLHVCYNGKTSRERKKAYDKLRIALGFVFPYREIFDLHDDHLEELAEIVQGLYPELEALDDYTYHILEYLKKQMYKYRTQKEAQVMLLSRNRHLQTQQPLEYLDLKYQTWTYTEGCHAGQMKMYTLLYNYLTTLVTFVQDGTIRIPKKG